MMMRAALLALCVVVVTVPMASWAEGSGADPAGAICLHDSGGEIRAVLFTSHRPAVDTANITDWRITPGQDGWEAELVRSSVGWHPRGQIGWFGVVPHRRVLGEWRLAAGRRRRDHAARHGRPPVGDRHDGRPAPGGGRVAGRRPRRTQRPESAPWYGDGEIHVITESWEQGLPQELADHPGLGCRPVRLGREACGVRPARVRATETGDVGTAIVAVPDHPSVVGLKVTATSNGPPRVEVHKVWPGDTSICLDEFDGAFFATITLPASRLPRELDDHPPTRAPTRPSGAWRRRSGKACALRARRGSGPPRSRRPVWAARWRRPWRQSRRS